MNVNSFFRNKVSEIKSRLPVDLELFSDKNNSDTSFSNYLKNSSENTSTQAAPTSAKNATPTYSAPSITTTANVGSFEKNSTASTPAMELINKSILESSKKYGVDPYLIRAVIQQESNFNPQATSPVGAQGLMQLMPGTARALNVQNSMDISQNIDGGTKYIKQQLTTFGGDVSLALAAYNAGPGNVKKYNGIPPFNETQNYVKKILANYNNIKK